MSARRPYFVNKKCGDIGSSLMPQGILDIGHTHFTACKKAPCLARMTLGDSDT